MLVESEMRNAARFAAIQGQAALFEVGFRVLDRLFKQMEFSYMNISRQPYLYFSYGTSNNNF